MKKIILTNMLLMAIMAIRAQSIEEGNKYLYYERANSAEVVFHQLLKENPNNGEAWLGLVKSYVLEDEIEKAGDTLNYAPASVKQDAYFKVAYGYVLLQQNNSGKAGEVFSQALNDTRQKNPKILAAIAGAHIDAKGGDANYAIDLLQKAIKKDKKNEALYVSLGDAYRLLNNGSEAFLSYQKALDKNKNYALAYHRIGKLFLTQNNPDVYLEYFKKAIAADPLFSPSLYTLYAYEFNRDPSSSMAYYNQYLKNADASIEQDIEMVDLLYINKQYDQAILKANKILQSEKISKPRLYKLMAYSYAESKDTVNAIVSMQKYFEKEADTNLIAKDYLAMADYYSAVPDKDSLTVVYLEKGSELEKDSTALYAYYQKLADLAKTNKDHASQAKWLEKYNTNNPKATNLDLFNWGLAHYLSGDYPNADSVFGIYTAKYPTQSYGYYWKAKAKALEDSSMKEGLAVPVYKKLIEVLLADTTDANFKKWIVDAYEYLAAYEANINKDYSMSVQYFKKILEIEPENQNALKYIRILEKDMANKNKT